jgi:hypothetical protein
MITTVIAIRLPKGNSKFCRDQYARLLAAILAILFGFGGGFE